VEGATDTTYRRRRVAAVAGALIAVGAIVALLALLGVWPFNDSGALSRAEFIAKGDAICKQAQTDFQDVQRTTPETTAAEAAVLTGKLVDISESEFNQINGLVPPASMQGAVDRYLKAREDGIKLLRAGYQAAQNDDFNAYLRAKKKLARTQRTRTHLAEAVGFHDCSQQFATSSAEPLSGG
jgi:hypothetical protein